MTSESEQSRSSFEENSSFHGEDHQCINASGLLEANDVCEELLGSKMKALELNDASGSGSGQQHRQQQQHQASFCDGSDSGVDIATTTANVSLQRALSNNSGGYASSTCGGLDESVLGFNGNMSCDSSMISYSSDLCELKAAVSSQQGHNTVLSLVHSGANYECCSENGSESSSVTGGGGCGHSPGNRKLMSGVKKKVALFEPNARTNTRDKDPTTSTGPSSAAAGQLSGSSRIRSRLSGITRTASLTRHSTGSPLLQPRDRDRDRDRARSREKSVAPSGGIKPTPTSAPAFRASQLRSKPQKPDSLPSSLTTHAAPSLQRSIVQRTPSLSRARTPGTPSDDGRWPSSLGGRVGGGAQTKRGLSATPDLASTKMRSSMLSMDIKSTSNSSPYGTMPRRRKQKSVEDLTGRSSRSSSTSRDPLSNPRMVSSVIMSSRKNLTSSYGSATPTSGTTKMLPPNSMSSLSASKTSLARSKQSALPKTKIYHETSAQTAITSGDLEKILSGSAPLTVAVDAAEYRDKQTQSDIRDKEMERLHNEIRLLADRENDLASQLAERAQRVTHLEHQLKQEREEKLAMQRELHLNTERVMGMLELARVSGTPTDDDGQCDSLLMLESQIQMSGHELIEKQEEIGKLRKLCRTLQAEMERSLVVQESLLHEKVAIEQESNELHDFLQHEKAAMCDALKEIEQEYQACKRLLENKDDEIKVLRDECRHLVRLNEQRRQENRLMQSKYTALENKSKELILQQNSSVSGASMSLSGLHSRLDSLVEQLVSSYNISDQDLEDIVFQNEVLTNGNNSVYEGGSCENQPSAATTSNGVMSHYAQTSDGSLSPQRNQSFIAAVISAIRHATTPSGKKLLSRTKKSTHEHPTNGESDSTTEMLDSETEPCLMMDNVLEDVTMPDSHSHNMVSSSCTGMISQIEVPSELINAGADESLQNLSQAITNRQQMELQINSLSVHKVSLQFNSPRDNSISEDVSFHDSVAEMPSLAEYGSAQTVVDQVIEVDNIVTKLLKVLRLIQMDNDNCIQQLILDKNKLQQNKEDMLEKLKDLQDVNIKLQDELMDATQELMLKNNDLSSTKAEMQRHRNEIDRLTEDICNLSTLCSNYKKLSPTTEFQPDLHSDLLAATDSNVDNAGILNLLKMWHQEGQFKETSVRKYLLGVLHVTAKESNANTLDNSHECLRIYENQLENVLKTLHDLHGSNVQHPSLQQLQKDIEDFKARMNWLGVRSTLATTDSAATADNLNANNGVSSLSNDDSIAT